MDYGLALTVLVFIEGLLILKALMELSNQISEELQDLDGTLAAAIQTVVENAGLGEPINPIQNALAQILVNSVNQAPGSVIELPTGDDGRFIKNE